MIPHCKLEDTRVLSSFYDVLHSRVGTLKKLAHLNVDVLFSSRYVAPRLILDSHRAKFMLVFSAEVNLKCSLTATHDWLDSPEE